ncbi:MAG: DUF1614 domain-containing protein [Candidatus Thermoplasmatota archaeon]|nr:DUF1614 domain-containing protein [Candidatus Thermoplasmatota archaeon]
MTDAASFIDLAVQYLYFVLLPLLALYIAYLIVTKAFQNMGFTSLEAVIIVFASFILGSGIVDGVAGIRFSNIPLFTYHQFWVVGINVGGAVVPILLSIYLSIKNKLLSWRILVGIMLVAVTTYLVTYPDPDKGIVSRFPFWILPIVIASVVSLAFYRKQKQKAAPLAYIVGSLGVLVGADVFHLLTLLEYEIHTTRQAVIGGASVFDMVFITGILAVFLDGFFIFQQKRKKTDDRY